MTLTVTLLGQFIRFPSSLQVPPKGITPRGETQDCSFFMSPWMLDPAHSSLANYTPMGYGHFIQYPLGV